MSQSVIRPRTPIEAARRAAWEADTGRRGGGADAAVRVVLEHLVLESDVLAIPAVATAYMQKLLEDLDA